ncbi:hypothetical protein DB30_08025 [Enhygromyxa salina]|uniref:Lipoprotein n=1 Tax=Enhygromyxa salina TaxID=215803 RepID=A0A0C1ZR77_9BACT|nr:hypothetical protein [Enhygromyxa salina]KIG13513.1 hypothetical protein DB30_08025 [Enhygromyxa salina]
MHANPRRVLPPLVALLAACAHVDGGAHRGDVIVSMTRVSVAPKPDAGERWDAAAQQGDTGGCELLGALSSFVLPGSGAIAAGVCMLASSSDAGGDLKPEDPDLFVGFEIGKQTYYSPVIPNRHSHDRPFDLFIPGELLRNQDLHVTIYDSDGASRTQATVIADAMLDAAALRKGVELQDVRLEKLRLHARTPPGQPQTTTVKISASDGLARVDGLDLPAGMIVEVRASGRYQIGSWNDAKIGPTGYPGGGPRDYNLPGPDFRRAAHGAAVALLQLDSSAQAIVVGDCARFVTESGGRLLVGVNDNDHRNNRGSITFEVRVLAPDVQTWSGLTTLSCDP